MREVVGEGSEAESKLVREIQQALKNSDTETVEFVTKNCVRAGAIVFHCNRFGYDAERSTRIVDFEADTPNYVIRAKKRKPL